MRMKIAFTRYKCDRCHASSDDLDEAVNPNEEWGRIWKDKEGPFDLCPKCKNSFNEWMDEPGSKSATLTLGHA